MQKGIERDCSYSVLQTLGGLEEINSEDAYEGFQGVAETGVDSDQVVGDGQQEESPCEEIGGGDAAAEGESEAAESDQ